MLLPTSSFTCLLHTLKHSTLSTQQVVSWPTSPISVMILNSFRQCIPSNTSIEVAVSMTASSMPSLLRITYLYSLRIAQPTISRIISHKSSWPLSNLDLRCHMCYAYQSATISTLALKDELKGIVGIIVCTCGEGDEGVYRERTYYKLLSKRVRSPQSFDPYKDHKWTIANVIWHK